MVTHILEVASFDGLIETQFYGQTYVPARVLVKLGKVSTIKNKIHLKESNRINQNYRTWIAVTQVIKSDMVPVELGVVSNNPGVWLGQQEGNQRQE